MILRKNIIDYGNPVNRAAPLNRGLVGWYRNLPGQNTGATCPDLCGRNPGTLTNGVLRQSGAGMPYSSGSYQFDGSDDSIVHSWNTSPLITDFSVAIWFNQTDAGSGAGRILCAHASSVSANDGWRLSNFSSGNFTFTLGGVGNYDLSTAMPYGEWIWWCVTVSNLTLNYYIRSVTTGYQSGGFPIFASSGTPAIFSQSSDVFSSAYEFKGRTDDIRLYDRAIVESEASSLYNASRTGYVNELNRISRPIGVKAAAGSAFQAAWARRSNQVIGIAGAA